MSDLVISLDFEMFWGVSDSRTVEGYQRNVAGVWDAIPSMLALFENYGVRATWATVGMLMCRDHAHWREVRPAVMPGYERKGCSNYEMGELARQHPRLFFGRPLVERILQTPGQELATHTYSHFYCDEPGATVDQFRADLECAKLLGEELGVKFRSLVFPRNQVSADFVGGAKQAGLEVWRGNPRHPLYSNGHTTPFGIAGRAVRLADAWIPLSGSAVARAHGAHGITNVPASMFLRPYSSALSVLEPLRLGRMKRAMTSAARADGIFHLWWHPHNFGADLDRNMFALESLLQHYQLLRDRFGMRSSSMSDFASKGLQ